MPFPLLAAELAPTAIKLGANLFRKKKKSPYEQKLQGLSDIYQQESQSPLDQNRIFKEGKRQLDRADEKNREAVQNSSAATGATDEARLAGMEQNNAAYGAALSRLFNTAAQYRERARSRYVNTLGALEGAKTARDRKFQFDLNNIVQPLSSAANSFALSSLFSDPNSIKALIKHTPDATKDGGPDSTDFGSFIKLYKGFT